jgi:thioesterase domain-containing protein
LGIRAFLSFRLSEYSEGQFHQDPNRPMSNGLEPKPDCVSIKALIPLWERVLRRSAVRADDNFFDLGGDISSAASLLQELERVCGRELPRFLIYHKPTIRGLADALAQPSLPDFPKLIPLRAGTEWPPIFIAPGMGGDPLDYFNLARKMETGHPIFAMQARGLDGKEDPFGRIEDIAEYYLDAIKKIQPEGPYILIGSSLGGLVTLEMAQQLSKRGEKVGLLVMLESYPHARYLSLYHRMRLLGQKVRNHASAVFGKSVRDGFNYVSQRVKRQLSNMTDSHSRSLPPEGVELSPAMQRLRHGDFQALTSYQPRCYAGKVKFVRAAILTRFPADPAGVWGRLIEKMDVETVPGDHNGIVTTHFDALAAALSRYLKEASI